MVDEVVGLGIAEAAYSLVQFRMGSRPGPWPPAWMEEIHEP